MRYFVFTITPEGGAIHPVGRTIAETAAITREALVYVNAHGNETGVMLYRLRGDPNELEARLDGHSDLITCTTVGMQNETFHFYTHVKPSQPAGQLVAIVQKYALILIPPFKFTNAGNSLRIMVVGTHEMLQQAIEELPDEIRISPKKAGEYSLEDQSMLPVNNNRNVLSLLTDRQLETLQTAVAEGYYDIPRRITREDLGDILGCAPSTVGEHLRKAESRVFTTLTQ